MEKSRNKAGFIKKFSITLRTNKMARALLIFTLASFLKRATVQLQRLLQEEESYTWVDCFANYRNSYERRCQELVQVLGL